MIGDVVLGCKRKIRKFLHYTGTVFIPLIIAMMGVLLGESNERHRMAPSFPETCRVRLRCEPRLGSLLYLCGQDAVP